LLPPATARDANGELLPVFAHVRSWCLLGAAAGGVPAIDAVWTDLGDLDGLRREAEGGAAMGFDGKITIHPAQIEIVNEAFTPAVEEVEQARALIAAFEEHAAQGRLSFRFEGAMVDAPHLARARRLLARAES
jgi:citrate lyase subunit beta / citryl-CoA lyase